jgi:hypothetical protein
MKCHRVGATIATTIRSAWPYSQKSGEPHRMFTRVVLRRWFASKDFQT